MSNEQIKKMINEQMIKEFYSAYLYLSIANYYAEQNLDGFANWFEIQAQEEMDHALLFRKYLINDNHTVCFEQINSPDKTYSNLGEPLNAALSHERMITASITEIYSTALECKDYKATQMLDWFIKEQGEEEKNANDLCKKFEMFGNDAKGLYLLNTELLARIYTPPTLIL